MIPHRGAQALRRQLAAAPPSSKKAFEQCIFKDLTIHCRMLFVHSIAPVGLVQACACDKIIPHSQLLTHSMKNRHAVRK